VRGNFTIEQALQQLLVNTGLRAQATSAQTYSVVSSAVGNGPSAAETAASSGEAATEGATANNESTANQAILVTGTRIRGVTNTASPVRTLGRKEIEATGATSTEGLLKLLPENVSGQTVETARAGVVGGQAQGIGYNLGLANGIDLRGLGSNATLVLLNGHRLPITSTGSTVDVSAIPLAVISRVDVLKDGASSVYGSDAVAGVVNFITLNRYDGAQTTLTAGTVTHGGKQDIKFDGVLGKTWDTGHVLAAYTYNDEGSLSTTDRSATRNSPPQFAIVPIRSHQLFATAGQELSDRLRFEVQGLASFRNINSSDVQAINRGLPDEQLYRDDTRIRNFSAVSDASLTYSLDPSWQIRLSGQFAASSTHFRQIVTPPLQPNFDAKFRGRNYGGELGVEGALFRLPGGDVRLAVGVASRRERYYGVSLERSLARTISSAYGEMFVPIVGETNRRPGADRLELTVSDRYDHYSDFGSTNNPKVGLLYAPTRHVMLRGTYSTSFRAPLLAEMGRVKSTGADFLFNGPDALSSTGRSLQLIRAGGGNPDLKPETARSFTGGVEVRPSSEIKASIEYFNIDFRNRIQKPSALPFLAANPTLYAPYITRNPSSEAVSEIINGPYFVNLVGVFDPNDIVLIVDDRLQNAQRVKESGFDFGFRYAHPLANGQLGLLANATYLASYKDQLLAGLSPIDRVNTPYYPARWRARGTTTWETKNLGAAISINFVSAYKNNLNPTDVERVPSWTTFDASLRYSVPAGSRLGGLSASLSISNLFDKDPPFVRNLTNIGGLGGTTTYNYDPVNASLLGRFISLTVSKKW
jgi:outer membrane receptor protein involved in Fe transport